MKVSLCNSYIHACLTPGRHNTFKTEKKTLWTIIQTGHLQILSLLTSVKDLQSMLALPT